MILTTDRLVLRPMTLADAPALFAILGDPQVMAFWDRPALPRLATVEAQMADELAAMAAGGFFYWTVWKGDDAIGAVDLSNVDGAGATMGFAFRREVWGQGLAREAMAALTGYALGPMRLAQVTARVQTGNQRALRMLTALGFHKMRELPDLVLGGERRPCALYARSAAGGGMS